MAHAIIIVGLPGSGKSSYVDMFVNSTYTKIDFDSYLELQMKLNDFDYATAWQVYKKEALSFYKNRIENAVMRNENIVVDKTNLTIASRARLLALLSQYDYSVECVFFDIAVDDCITRMNRRPNKIIPQNVMLSMSDSMVAPVSSEGFNNIVRIV